MPHTLPGAWSLIKDSWALFTKTWSTTVKYSAWFVLSGLHVLLFLFIPGGVEANAGWFLFTALLLGLLLLWPVAMVYQVAFAVEADKHVTSKTTEDAPRRAVSILWIGILKFFAFAAVMLLPMIVLIFKLVTQTQEAQSTAAVLIGTALLFLLISIPFLLGVIYLGIRLGFSELALFGADTRGRAALVESWKLTAGKFWAILWRQIAAGVVFGLLILVVLWIAVLIVELIAGSAVTASLSVGGSNTEAGDVIASILSSFVQAAVLPLMVIYQVKLYRALEKSGA